MLPDFRFAIGAALAVAVLAVTSFGLLTAVRFTHHGKPGPIESSRNLVFDDRTDWNPFYDAESARRFGAPGRKAEAAEAAVQGADGGTGEAASPAAAAVEVAHPDGDGADERAVPAATAAIGSDPPASADPVVAAAHPADEPEETGALPAAPPAPPSEGVPTPIAEGRPPAPADHLANAPAAAPEIAGPEAPAAPAATAPAETKPAGAKPTDAVKPVRKAAKPRLARSTQRQSQPRRSFPQPLGAGQYWQQQYPPQLLNNPLSQPYGSGPNQHWGG